MSLYQDLRREGESDERSLVREERDGARVTLTLADPKRLNPLSAGLNLQLQQRLEGLMQRALSVTWVKRPMRPSSTKLRM